jgi:hypothetical protein
VSCSETVRRRTFGAPSRPLSTVRFRLAHLQLLLLAVVVIAAIPRLYLGATQFVAYDGYWHVFIAQQDRWRNFFAEYRADAHPPLYYLALRATLWFGRSILVYRAVSLLAGIASVYVIGRVASRVMRTPLMQPLAALGYGLALPSILISLEVRQYMLCIFFVLVSYCFFLDVIVRNRPDDAKKPRIAFAFFGALACLTHYCAVFYVTATLVLSILVILVRRSEPLRWALRREAATFMPVFAVTGYEYIRHFGAKGVAWGHLPSFYYQRGGADSLPEFLLRNSQNVFNLFSPWPLQSSPVFLAVCIVLVAGLAWFVFHRTANTMTLPVIVTVLMPVMILAQIILGGVFRIYPFGGELRQQFVIFPFLVLGTFLLLDWLMSAIPRALAYGLVASLALGIAAVSLRALHALPDVRDPVMKAQMVRFDGLFPTPEAVYVDQFSLITFFTFHDNWKWTFLERVPGEPSVEIYRLTRGGRHMLLFRDRYTWLLDFHQPALYRKVETALHSQGVRSATVFYVRQDPPQVVLSAALKAEDRRWIGNLSASQELCVQALDLNGYDISAEFRAWGCTYEQSTAAVIEYEGAWKSGAFPRAASGILTYSNQSGANAAFFFQGTGITYVYTKAFNRGRARVSIDGQERAILDLYDPQIVWRASTVFSGLAPGGHVFEVSVLNSRSPASQDTYVDVDQLIPQ